MRTLYTGCVQIRKPRNIALRPNTQGSTKLVRKNGMYEKNSKKKLRE